MARTYQARLKQKILTELKAEGGVEAFTPGLQIAVVYRGRRKARLALGKTYPYYDLASLTKIIFTVPALIQLFEARKLHLEDNASKFLSWWPHRGPTIRELLTHSGGLKNWAPFYDQLKGRPSQRYDELKSLITKIPKGRKGKALYSDLDFLLLGFILEEVTGKKWIDLWREQQKRLKLHQTHFHPKNKPVFARNLYAPTEGRQGEVHDDNTRALGGVAPHAGLFAPLEDVVRYGMLLREGYFSGSALGSKKAVRTFTRRSLPVGKGDWALGFMMPSRGKASSGSHFSLKSFGHLGFTGTSLWFDPVRDLLVVILSNRVHPTRDNPRFATLRPRLHDWICELL